MHSPSVLPERKIFLRCIERVAFGVVEILKRVRSRDYGAPPFRPSFDVNTPDTDLDLFELMKSCWDETPAQRPTFKNIIKSIIKINNGKYVYRMSDC